jgi:hypothetical protein
VNEKMVWRRGQAPPLLQYNADEKRNGIREHLDGEDEMGNRPENRASEENERRRGDNIRMIFGGAQGKRERKQFI